MRKPHNRQSLVPGSRFGKLVVLDDSAPGFEAKFQCDCGEVVSKNRTSVRTGMTQSCGCLHRAHATEVGFARSKAPGFAEFNVHYGVYARRALKRGIEFCLTPEDFFEITHQLCYFCGLPPEKGNTFLHHGIDRLDSSKGYTVENSVACCEICNRAKSNMPVDKFEQWMDRLSEGKPYRPQGYVAISQVKDGFGKIIPYEKAVKYGWIGSPNFDTKSLYDKATGEEVASPNLFLDQGRQLLAYAFAFRSPIENYVCRKFGVGTGLTTATVADVALESPITLASTAAITAPIDSIDFLSAFLVRVSFTLALGDANGYVITEMGLFSGNNTLMARKIRAVAVNKTSDFSPTLTWRIRF